MIHTAQLNLLINHHEKEHFISLEDTEWRTPTKNTMYPVNYHHSNSGVRTAWITQTSTATILSVRVNLNRLALGGTHTVHPLPASDEALAAACRNLAPKLDYFAPGRTLDEWSLYRIDYTLDIRPGNVPIYIDLLQRGDKPHGYTVHRGWREEQECKRLHRTPLQTHLDGSCTYACGSLHLSFYDKQRERIDQEAPQQEIAESSGVLRFEMRSMKAKIRSLAGLGGWDDLSLASCQQGSNYTAAQMRRYLRLCCHAGNYYTLAEARNRINATPWTAPKKARAIEALELTNGKRSIWKARESYDTQKEKESFNRRLKELEEIGINPVTIPESYGIQTLPSLLPLFDAQLTAWMQLGT